MEQNGIIYEIKSKYTLKHIYDYIQDELFPQKIFYHSKVFQNKIEINYSYCYKKYLEEMGFELNKYLYIDEEMYEKDRLRKEYDNFISKNKLNKTKFENIIYEVMNNQNEIDKKKYINIDSPLFGILSKTKVFENYFIYISQKNLEQYELKNDYILFFKSLNNSGRKFNR